MPGFSETFTLTIRLMPPQAPNAKNYDLYLYDDSGNPLDSSTNPDCAEDAIVRGWAGTYGLSDSREFRVEVRGAGGDSSPVPYAFSLTHGDIALIFTRPACGTSR